MTTSDAFYAWQRARADYALKRGAWCAAVAAGKGTDSHEFTELVDANCLESEAYLAYQQACMALPPDRRIGP